MSQTLYEEAIAEARRLTEMAEQNAKNKIIDAVTPRIKRLIEEELLSDRDDGEMDEVEDDEEDETPEAGDFDSVSSEESPAIDLDSLGAMSTESPAQAPAGKAVKAFSVSDDGKIDIDVGDVEISIKPTKEDEVEPDLNLPMGVEESLSRMLAGSPSARRKLRNRLTTLEGKLKVLKTALVEARNAGTPSQKQRIAGIFEQLAKEAVTLRSQAILTERITGGRTLETNIANSIIKEMRDMSRRNNRNVFDFLFEADDDKAPKGDDLDLDLGMEAPEASGDETSDIDAAVKTALESLEDVKDKLESALGMSGEEAEEAEEEAEETEEETEEEVTAETQMHYEGESETESDSMGETYSESRVYEINESELRRELNRLRKINESDAVSGSGASSFGGGKAGDDMFVDVDEETLLNALADELGTAPKPKIGGAQLAKESLSRRSALAEASQLRRQVADYRSVAEQLKGQLVEMNLFNAKLLYANKLMQNRDLSAKQQRAIVEALDNAKTLREAKLLYKSLTESLNKSTNKGGLTEGTRVLGSSSKSARSAQPNLLAEGGAGGTDRWALLAGIKKD
jgi:hypothetical protein